MTIEWIHIRARTFMGGSVAEDKLALFKKLKAAKTATNTAQTAFLAASNALTRLSANPRTSDKDIQSAENAKSAAKTKLDAARRKQQAAQTAYDNA